MGRAVIKALGLPDTILAALEVLWDGYLMMPATSLGDTLLLADELAPVESPLAELSGMSQTGGAADLDMRIGEELLRSQI